MTQEEIIEMAQECGLVGVHPHLDGIYVESLVAFAKRVAAVEAAAERERIIAANAPEIERCNAHIKMLEDELAAIKEALAQPEQEPVATVTSETGANITMSWWHEPPLPVGTKLYTHPPQNVIDKSAAIRIATSLGWTPPRTWVGLTDEEQRDIAYSDINVWDWGELMDAVEAKLKEKNSV